MILLLTDRMRAHGLGAGFQPSTQPAPVQFKCMWTRPSAASEPESRSLRQRFRLHRRQIRLKRLPLVKHETAPLEVTAIGLLKVLEDAAIQL